MLSHASLAEVLAKLGWEEDRPDLGRKVPDHGRVDTVTHDGAEKLLSDDVRQRTVGAEVLANAARGVALFEPNWAKRSARIVTEVRHGDTYTLVISRECVPGWVSGSWPARRTPPEWSLCRQEVPSRRGEDSASRPRTSGATCPRRGRVSRAGCGWGRGDERVQSRDAIVADG